MVGQVSVFVPMKGLIDPNAELSRLQKELDKLQKQRDQISGKLNNENFVAKAPANVVESERLKLDELSGQIQKLKENMEEIQGL